MERETTSKERIGGPRGRRSLALACLYLLASAAPASAAAMEQVGCFAGTGSDPCAPVTEEAFGEEVQLGGIGGMAVNYSGAGGVAKGTVYAATRTGTDTRVAMFVPKPGGLKFVEEWVVSVAGGAYEVCGPVGTLPNGDTDPHPSCPPRVEDGTGVVDVDMDEATGNVYVLARVLAWRGRKRWSSTAPREGKKSPGSGNRRRRGRRWRQARRKCTNRPTRAVWR